MTISSSGEYNEATPTSKPNQTKQIFWHIFKKCKRLIYFLARILREMVEAKSDLHKIQDIFYLKHFLIEEMMSYDSADAPTDGSSDA